MKTVTKIEFDEFIKNYPKPLTSGCTMICEPPFRSFRDESIATNGKVGSIDYYFDKEVAREIMEWVGPNGEVDTDNTKKFWTYEIKTGGKQ